MESAGIWIGAALAAGFAGIAVEAEIREIPATSVKCEGRVKLDSLPSDIGRNL